jgi:hypothetical protein
MVSRKKKKCHGRKRKKTDVELMVVIPVNLPAHYNHPNVEYGIDKLEREGSFPAIAC